MRRVSQARVARLLPPPPPPPPPPLSPELGRQTGFKPTAERLVPAWVLALEKAEKEAKAQEQAAAPQSAFGWVSELEARLRGWDKLKKAGFRSKLRLLRGSLKPVLGA